MKKLLVAAAAMAASVLLALAGPIVTPASAADAGTEAQFVSAINRIRANHGLSQLQVHGELVAVGRNWSDRMASRRQISHNPNVGSQVTANWVLIGENVGTGGDVGSLMDAFMASPSHRANLLEPDYNHVGVGVTWGADGRMYTTHLFMDLASAPAPAPPPPPPPAPAPPAPAAPDTGAPAPADAAPAAPPAPTVRAEPVRVAVMLDAVRPLDAGVR